MGRVRGAGPTGLIYRAGRSAAVVALLALVLLSIFMVLPRESNAGVIPTISTPTA